ncbi:unnamed protein product [Meloidogyne enterolobii]|uniref:Uncharacterized protein n=1 Tax=Meloidogyne enterolobii TaxID=390850 RepID=A0ACB1A2C1_MELEN
MILTKQYEAVEAVVKSILWGNLSVFRCFVELAVRISLKNFFSEKFDSAIL